MVEVLLHRASAIGHDSGPQLANDAQYVVDEAFLQALSKWFFMRAPTKALQQDLCWT
jgi:hypothetical protein